ncbi:MAG: amidohydrolase family protein [Syntrophobacterales bacterium]|nr:amidohydrolase family protein [Syntrophobacterales bacterium]
MIIDCHVHCGELDDSAPQTYEEIAPEFDEAGLDGAVCFSPVMEIYDRYSLDSRDDEYWQNRRRHSREYLRSLKNKARRIYPFHFVWNDFDTSDLEQYCGIKWHRHGNEPEYHYDDPKCARMIDAIREQGFAILLEETYENTLRFVDGMGKGIPFIIPHLGHMNGGFRRFLNENFWERENTYADMSSELPELNEIREFIDRYGPHRLLYGSDYPFSTPLARKKKIMELNLPAADEELIFSGNIMRLLKNVEGEGVGGYHGL